MYFYVFFGWPLIFWEGLQGFYWLWMLHKKLDRIKSATTGILNNNIWNWYEKSIKIILKNTYFQTLYWNIQQKKQTNRYRTDQLRLLQRPSREWWIWWMPVGDSWGFGNGSVWVVIHAFSWLTQVSRVLDLKRGFLPFVFLKYVKITACFMAHICSKIMFSTTGISFFDRIPPYMSTCQTIRRMNA